MSGRSKSRRSSSRFNDCTEDIDRQIHERTNRSSKVDSDTHDEDGHARHRRQRSPSRKGDLESTTGDPNPRRKRPDPNSNRRSSGVEAEERAGQREKEKQRQQIDRERSNDTSIRYHPGDDWRSDRDGPHVRGLSPHRNLGRFRDHHHASHRGRARRRSSEQWCVDPKSLGLFGAAAVGFGIAGYAWEKRQQHKRSFESKNLGSPRHQGAHIRSTCSIIKVAS